jgi:predicted nucleic acid-binding protein
MKTLRIYADTSVLGGVFDAEFARWSRALLDDFRLGRYRAVLSDVTAAEVALAPEPVRMVHAELVARGAELVPVSPAALELIEHYEAHGVLGHRYRNDMLHIALATIADADVLVSWNFRHIVRLDKIRVFNAVNLEAGYKALAIHSPREVASQGDENDDQDREK